MSSYAFLLKGKQKFQVNSLFVQFAAADDKTAQARLTELLANAGHDHRHYFKPLRTNLPIVNDLPADGVFDDTWCDRYVLADDGLTWTKKPGQTTPPAAAAEKKSGDTLTQRVLGAWLFERFETLTPEQQKAIVTLQFDDEATYAQNLLLACRNSSVRQLEFVYPSTMFELVAAAKSVWPVDGKAPAFAPLLQFIQEWLVAHNDSAARADGRMTMRQDVIEKWIKKIGKGKPNEKGQVLQSEDPCAAVATPVTAATEPAQPLEENTAANDDEQPEVTAAGDQDVRSMGNGVYDVSALFANSRFAEPETQSAQSVTETAQIVTEISPAAPETPETVPNKADAEPPAPAPEYPAYFEPGRYADLPNGVYHSANGISSTMVKDARVSLLYYYGRNVAKTIVKEESRALSSGQLVHTMTLQPEKLADEFNIEPILPPGVFTTAASMKKAIEAYNAALEPGLSNDEIKQRIEVHNGTLRQPFPLGGDVTETGMLYGMLPADFQTIPAEQKHTAAAMKAAIKQYNATLPPLPKTTGSRDELLATLETIDPELVAAERSRPQPVNTSGTKEELIATVKKIRPSATFADEIYATWKGSDDGRTLVTQKQMQHAKALQGALLAHPTIGPLLQHPSRESEVSYFGFDDDTGLELRVRPDAEINTGAARIGLDLKTISMWGVKQDQVKARLHREIISRDYHLSAAMYCDVAGLDQFFWVFINSDEDYAWVAIVEASPDLLQLGRLEYKKTLREIDNAQNTGIWPAPITADYIDDLNDSDQRRLEWLQKMETAQ